MRSIYNGEEREAKEERELSSGRVKMPNSFALSSGPGTKEHRHTVLLGTLLALYIINPFVQVFFSSRPGLILLDLLVSTTLLAATYAVYRSKGMLLGAAIFAGPAIAGRWASYAVYSDWLSIFSHCFGFLFLAFTAGAILLNVLRPVRVTGDIVNGAVCVYMLAGLAWAFLFSLLEVLQPGSFNLPALSTDPLGLASMEVRRLSVFMYYSLVTLTTLGYGDITPVTPLARNLAAFEAVMGQLYIAILVARLVGLHIVHSGPEDRER